MRLPRALRRRHSALVAGLLISSLVLVAGPGAGASPEAEGMSRSAQHRDHSSQQLLHGLFASHLGERRASTAAAAPPSGFQDSVVFSGLTQPTAARFAPDGKVFVAEQSGIIKEYDSLSDSTATVFADLSTNVENYNDRGLLGLAVDPGWPAKPYVYASYTYDAPIGGQAPTWSDGCPDPTVNGCVVSGRLSRLQQGGGSATPYDSAVLADTPAAYWRLGDASGTTAVDSSGNGRSGSYVGSPTLGQPGALSGSSNTAVGFNGTSQYVEVPSAAALNPNAFSVEAWAYPTGGQGTYRSVVTSRDYSGGVSKGYVVYASSANTWQFWLGSGGSSWGVVYGPAVQLNQWTHLVATYDGLTARLYVNGALAASASLQYSANTTRPLRMAAGATEGSPNFQFPGRLDEVAVYGSALPAGRVQAHYDSGTGGGSQLATETVLINDWCQQFPSESVGDLAFGADGSLYLSGGTGGSFYFNDWGQNGNPPNPCGDPPGGVGTSLSPPTAEGGSLRAQDLRTSGDPVTLDGSTIRVDPSTGAAMSDNPMASASDPNQRRIIAYGYRNPFRATIRPGTNELWVGDVGAGTYEEINRIADTRDSVVEDFGWPCYEGAPKQGGFDAANLDICENLYATPNAVTAPYFAYAHGQPITAGESCPTANGSAISGLAFVPDSSPFPASYHGALLFTDYARSCIWAMLKGTNGLPDPATVQVFETGSGSPVDLQFGPDGQLYYVDIGSGTVHRISYTAGNQPPVAVATANPTSGAVPLTVSFDGSGSSDPDGDPITYSWDLNGDGVFGDSTAAKPSYTYTQTGNYTVKLRVTDSHGAATTSSPITIAAGNTPPTATILTPSPSFTWKVGDTISFSGSATDAQDGTLSASSMSWNVTLFHCPSACHTHPVTSFTGVSSGSFAAIDHGYPSYLEITLTVTDSGGLTDTKKVDIYPQTLDLQFASSPSGLQIQVNDTQATTPFTSTVIVNSVNTISAITPQTVGGTAYAFSSWSDGGAQSHNVTASQPATYTATYSVQQAGAYQTAVLSDAPAAYWRLGDAFGTTAADASGNGRAGTYVNSPTLGAAGAISGDTDTAVGLNGTTQYVQAPYASALNGSTFAAEAWAYPTGGAKTFRAVVSSRDYTTGPTATRGFVLYASDADRWELWLGTGSGFWNKVLGPPVTLNKWTYLAVTYDGTTARLYVDGALAASGSFAYSPNTANPLRAGAGSNESSARYFFPGRLDEVAVYGSALTAARVSAHFQAAQGSGSNNPPNAVATASPTSGVVPLTVSFDGSGSSDPDGDPITYSWDLNGDGVFGDSTAAKPSYTYTQAGTYSVKLQVTDSHAATSTSSPITVTATSTSSSYSSTVLADAPAAYWRLGEASGTTAADASGNSRPGSYVGGPTLGIAGAISGDSNTCAAFNGTSQYVQVPYSAALNASAFSVEAWIYPTGGAGTFRSVVTSRDYTGSISRGFALYASDADRWELWLGTGAGFWNKVLGPAVTLNQWTHLVATYDGVTARLYVNGAQVASATVGYVANGAQPLRLAAGATEASPRYFLPGRLDEVAVYSSALSAARVQAHYNAGKGV